MKKLLSLIVLLMSFFTVNIGFASSISTQQQSYIKSISSLKSDYLQKFSNIKTSNKEITARINLKKSEINQLAKTYTDSIKNENNKNKYQSIYNDLENLFEIKLQLTNIETYKLNTTNQWIISAQKNAIIKDNTYSIIISTNKTTNEIKQILSKYENNFSIQTIFKLDSTSIVKINLSKNSYIWKEIETDLNNNILIKNLFWLDVLSPGVFSTQSSSSYTVGENIWNLWWIYSIKADKYQEELSKKTKTLVWVIDTWIDYFHKDLKPNIFKNSSEIAWNWIDDDKNGYIDDVYWYNFVNNNSDIMDKNWHWTHVAGSIWWAINMVWIYWVNSNANIFAIKAVDNNGYANDFDIAQGIKYATNSWVKVINLSISWKGTQDNIICKAISYANERWVIVITAAGNDWENAKNTIPWICAWTINVGAYDWSKIKTTFSNYGKDVTVYAPGTNISSSIPWDQYNAMQWTSMAAAHVSWLVSALLSYNQNIWYKDMINILQQNWDQIVIKWDSSIWTWINMEKTIKALWNTTINPVTIKSFTWDNDTIYISNNIVTTTPTNISNSSSSSTSSTTTTQSTNFSYTNSMIWIECKSIWNNTYVCRWSWDAIKQSGMSFAFFVNGKLYSQDSKKATIKLTQNSTIRFSATSDKKYNYAEIKINIK